MYQKGELVIYGNSGICRVEEIGVPADMPMGCGGKQYYTLSPIFGSGTIYASVDTKVFMRPILSREQAEELIVEIPNIPEEAFAGKDMKALSGKYKSFLDTHQCEDLVRLIKTVYQKERVLVGKGKKLAKTEQEFGKLAKELLQKEFSVALGLPYEEVEDYITKKVEALK